MADRVKAGFVEPMLLLRTDTLPDDPKRCEYQLKFDGYRAIAFKTGGKLYLRSRNNNDFSLRYAMPAVCASCIRLIVGYERSVRVKWRLASQHTQPHRRRTSPSFFR
jgi:hypothetical protein